MEKWKRYAVYFSDAPDADKQYGLYINGEYVGSGNRSEFMTNSDGTYRCYIEFKPKNQLERIVILHNIEPNNLTGSISFKFSKYNMNGGLDECN